MPLSDVREPVAAAAVSAAVAAGFIALFIPPLSERVVRSPLMATLFGLGIAAALVLYLIYVGIAAHRLNRSTVGWPLLFLAGFPIAPIVGFVLYEWYRKQEETQQGSAPRAGAV